MFLMIIPISWEKNYDFVCNDTAPITVVSWRHTKSNFKKNTKYKIKHVIIQWYCCGIMHKIKKTKKKQCYPMCWSHTSSKNKLLFHHSNCQCRIRGGNDHTKLVEKQPGSYIHGLIYLLLQLSSGLIKQAGENQSTCQ